MEKLWRGGGTRKENGPRPAPCARHPAPVPRSQCPAPRAPRLACTPGQLHRARAAGTVELESGGAAAGGLLQLRFGQRSAGRAQIQPGWAGGGRAIGDRAPRPPRSPPPSSPSLQPLGLFQPLPDLLVRCPLFSLALQITPHPFALPSPFFLPLSPAPSSSPLPSRGGASPLPPRQCCGCVPFPASSSRLPPPAILPGWGWGGGGECRVGEDELAPLTSLLLPSPRGMETWPKLLGSPGAVTATPREQSRCPTKPTSSGLDSPGRGCGILFFLTSQLIPKRV